MTIEFTTKDGRSMVLGGVTTWSLEEGLDQLTIGLDGPEMVVIPGVVGVTPV